MVNAIPTKAQPPMGPRDYLGAAIWLGAFLFEVTPQNETWAARVEAERDVGAVGVGSCSTVGANGATGCNTQFVRRQTKVRKADDRAATADLSGY